jgi:hypothetical protein
MKRTLQPREIRAERRGGRAAHFTAKATDSVLVPEWTLDAPGVGRRARGEGLAGNRRGPPRRPASGEGGTYKPKVKWCRAGRESEGLIVPLRARTRTAPEGRGLALIAPENRGKCEGMAGRPNNPVDKARELDDRLFALAERGWSRRPRARESGGVTARRRSEEPSDKGGVHAT